MPSGRVKWFEAERGFGFVTSNDGEDAYLSAKVLPKGVTEVHRGQQIDYDYFDGNKGPQVLRVTSLGPSPEATRKRAYSADQLGSMIADVVTLLENNVQPGLMHNRYPDRKTGRQVAEILRAIAKELDS